MLDINATITTLETMEMTLQIVGSIVEGIPLDLVLSDGTLWQDMKLALSVSDGFKVQPCKIDISAVQLVPIFKAVYALHLQSAIKEV